MRKNEEKATKEQGTRRTSYNVGQRGAYLPIHNGGRGSGNVVEADSRRYTNADGFAGGVYTQEGGNGGWGVDSDGKRISREIYERTKGSAIRDEEGNLIAVYYATGNLSCRAGFGREKMKKSR